MTADTEADSSSEDDSFLGADKNTVWMAKIQLQGKPVEFKLDTGAEVTVISEKVYHTLRDVKLSRPLYRPVNQTLQVVDQFPGTLKRGRQKHSEKIYGLHNNTLGLPAVITLQLSKCNDNSDSSTTAIP